MIGPRRLRLVPSPTAPTPPATPALSRWTVVGLVVPDRGDGQLLVAAVFEGEHEPRDVGRDEGLLRVVLHLDAENEVQAERFGRVAGAQGTVPLPVRAREVEADDLLIRTPYGTGDDVQIERVRSIDPDHDGQAGVRLWLDDHDEPLNHAPEDLLWVVRQ